MCWWTIWVTLGQRQVIYIYGTYIGGLQGSHWDRGRWDICWWTIRVTLGERQLGHMLVDYKGHIGAEAGGTYVG